MISEPGGNLINMYTEPIDTINYKFKKHFTITELGYSDKNNIQIELILNQSNFDFSKLNNDFSDIRFSESPTGVNSLFYWIAKLNIVNKNCVIWIEIPELLKNEEKIVYVFFGNINAISQSSINNLNFNFKYVFDHSPISMDIFSGNVNNGTSNNYYSLSNYNSTFETITNPLKGTTSWEMFTCIYSPNYSVNVNYTDYRTVLINLIGHENEISFYFANSSLTRHTVETGQIISYPALNSGLVSDHYNFISFSYKEDIDTFYYDIYNRLTINDYSSIVQRSVEGNTRPTDLQFIGTYGCSTSYLGYVLIRPFIKGEFELNLSTLYPEISDYYNDMDLNLITYTENVANISYYHESSCGGVPTNLSNGLYNGINTGWVSESSNECSVFIDFSRDHTNLVHISYRHIDSGHFLWYNASKLSDATLTTYEYWLSKYTTGWACIDFGTAPKQVNCLVLEGYDENGMIKDFTFEGSYVDPRYNDLDWTTIYTGTCEKNEQKQFFYFKNFNSFRYYRIKVTSTYGNNIKLKNWYMYEAPDVDAFNGLVVNRISLLPSEYGSFNNYFPIEINVMATNDYITWDTLLENSITYNPFNDSVYGYWQHFNFNNSKPYRVYKLTMYDNWTSTSGFVIDAWELTKSTVEQNTHRILSFNGTTDPILNVYTKDSTTFDEGWVFCGDDNNLFYIYDNYLARQLIIDGISDLITIL